MLSSRRWLHAEQQEGANFVSLTPRHTSPLTRATSHSLPYLSHTCFLLILAFFVSLGSCGQGGGLDSAAGRCTFTHVSNSLRLCGRVDVLLAGSCGRDIPRPSPAIGVGAEQTRGCAAAWFGWTAWPIIGPARAGARVLQQMRLGLAAVALQCVLLLGWEATVGRGWEGSNCWEGC